MKTFGDLFTGGGLACVGAMMAGYTPLFGLEIDPDIAAVANANLGGHIRIGDVLEANPADFPYVDLLHASPPCTRASVANANATESELDIALSRKIVEFVQVLRPRNVTVENVRGYRKFKAFQIIMDGLRECGYQAKAHILDSVDYGVPQNRIRLIVMASLPGMPRKPLATHQKRKDGQASLFETRLPNWIGWYESLIDLIPSLPLAHLRPGLKCAHDPHNKECRESEYCRGHFADWQESRLPEELQSFLLPGAGNTNFKEAHPGKGCRQPNEPCHSITSMAEGGSMPRAFIVEGSAAGVDNKFNMPVRAEGEPIFTMRAGQNNPRAFIVGDQRSHDGQQAMVRDFDKPVFVTDTRPAGKLKAFIVDGQETVPGKDGRVASTRPSDAPYLTVSATVYKGMPKAHVDQGRVVKMTPRALARFMSLSDSYRLPESNKLSCKLLGNGFPCNFAKAVFEAFK